MPGVSSVVASAPGSLMLFGEHAVLRGYPAIVAAVSARITVTVSVRQDRQIVLVSDAVTHSTTLDALAVTPGSRFVLGAVAYELARGGVTTGLDLNIQSDFSPLLGLGSSAAVTVATLAALRRLGGGDGSRAALCHAGVDVVREVQGLGSGADVAASVHGGVLSYQAELRTVQPLCPELPLTVVYSGSKLPTVEVVARVKALEVRFPEAYAAIFAAMGRVSVSAATALTGGDLPDAGRLMDMGQGLMAALGVSNERLDGLCAALRRDPQILGAKISGSGLGDCVIGLGVAGGPPVDGQRLDVALSRKGVAVDRDVIR